MNSQETNQPDSSRPIDPSLTIGLDNAHLSCTEVRGQGEWDRMDGNEIRWRWIGSKNVSLSELLGAEVKTHRFPSVSNAEQSIHLCKLADGGMVSYELENGVWLHTLNTAKAFRLRVFEINLVPLETLRYFLTASSIPGIDYAGKEEGHVGETEG
ncbi:MAG: hypothetical protein JKY95_08860 [Planctomycetaceae bacterium]|nr:hypothetical protein [Planctomycetaceae bacterium]